MPPTPPPVDPIAAVQTWIDACPIAVRTVKTETQGDGAVTVHVMTGPLVVLRPPRKGDV